MIYPLGWEENNNILEKVFEFEDFVQAVNFVENIVPLAEKLNHHPDIDIFGYNKVKIKVTTHDEGKITKKDIILSDNINTLFYSSQS